MSKDKILILCFFLIGIFLFNNERAESDSLYGKCIYLDPGHGGLDPGAIYGGVKEEDINLEIAFKLKESLEEKGAIVYLTRDGDYDLSNGAKLRKRSDLYKRSVLINNSGCDMYLSIHLNASTSTNWKGAQVFYDDINKENVKIAKILQEELKNDFHTNRKYGEVKDGYLYRHVKVPGVLVELGFLSNPYERKNLRNSNYQKRIADSLANGIEKYFKN